MGELRIDRKYLEGTLADLIRINSVNPALVPGAPGEGEIATYVVKTLRRLGLDAECQEVAPGRMNAVGRIRGTGGGRSLMLNGHLDTVGVEGMAEPFTPVVRDGRMFGRGAYDMKGGVTACIVAVKALADAGVRLRGDVVVAGVADEEYASIGTAHVARRVPVDAAVVTEATGLELCLAHKGFVWLEVETLGRAAHGSRFAEGIDANMRMGRVLAELDRLEQELRGRPPHPLVGPPSLHAAMLQGGTELSTYAARCVLKIERRTVPGESLAQIESEIQQILDRLARRDPTFAARLGTLLERKAFEAPPGSSLVASLETAATTSLGRAPRRVGAAWWMDTAILAEAGIEAAVIGPSGAGPHAAEEWVDLRSVEDVARILARLAVDYCS